ncbi:hypothetical protein J6590_083500 [Homalodisca vitripennis]|nr:hypothetical protein J6590_083500 [Homalodisca vitripennis]
MDILCSSRNPCTRGKTVRFVNFLTHLTVIITESCDISTRIISIKIFEFSLYFTPQWREDVLIAEVLVFPTCNSGVISVVTSDLEHATGNNYVMSLIIICGNGLPLKHINVPRQAVQTAESEPKRCHCTGAKITNSTSPGNSEQSNQVRIEPGEERTKGMSPILAFTFLLAQCLVSDAVTDLTPGIWSHIRLKK